VTEPASRGAIAGYRDGSGRHAGRPHLLSKTDGVQRPIRGTTFAQYVEAI
jgi:hypothetical protein